jgi:hypothetical protein
VNVRIGVTQNAKEIEVELPEDADREAVKASIEQALAGTTTVLWLPDRRGSDIAVPAEKIAYVEIGGAGDGRRIGFAG